MNAVSLLVLLIVGVGLVAIGAAMIYPPAAFLVLGLACVGVATRAEVAE